MVANRIPSHSFKANSMLARSLNDYATTTHSVLLLLSDELFTTDYLLHICLWLVIFWSISTTNSLNFYTKKSERKSKKVWPFWFFFLPGSWHYVGQIVMWHVGCENHASMTWECLQEATPWTAHQGEALLGLSQSRVRPELDALIKVSHSLLHLVQQDLQLRGGSSTTPRLTLKSFLWVNAVNSAYPPQKHVDISKVVSSLIYSSQRDHRYKGVDEQ